MQSLESNKKVKDAVLKFQEEMNGLIYKIETLGNTIESNLIKNTIENSLQVHN